MPSIIATEFEAKALAEGRLSAFVRPFMPQPTWDIVAHPIQWPSPFGRPGDALAVKETWVPEGEQWIPTGGIIYKATNSPECDEEFPWHWRSGAVMPAWAVRHHLTVVSVEVKRAADLSCPDFIAAGARTALWGHDARASLLAQIWSVWDDRWSKRGYPWDGNPWVWIARVKPAEGGSGEKGEGKD